MQWGVSGTKERVDLLPPRRIPPSSNLRGAALFLAPLGHPHGLLMVMCLGTAASLCGCIIQELFLSPVAALEINVSLGSTWGSWRAEARTHALPKKETVTAEYLCSRLVVFLIRIPFLFLRHTALFRSSESSHQFLIEFPKPLEVAWKKLELEHALGI